jgi:hypothetical protein
MFLSGLSAGGILLGATIASMANPDPSRKQSAPCSIELALIFRYIDGLAKIDLR